MLSPFLRHPQSEFYLLARVIALGNQSPIFLISTVKI